ncbi:MAG: hypothetical protein D6816_02395 [Bacteroidetes bacterium]|nr:MAG: hypothetical protein D6816_02395 [Bacteroidota bacterium]
MTTAYYIGPSGGESVQVRFSTIKTRVVPKSAPQPMVPKDPKDKSNKRLVPGPKKVVWASLD